MVLLLLLLLLLLLARDAPVDEEEALVEEVLVLSVGSQCDLTFRDPVVPAFGARGVPRPRVRRLDLLLRLPLLLLPL